MFSVAVMEAPFPSNDLRFALPLVEAPMTMTYVKQSSGVSDYPKPYALNPEPLKP